MDSNDDYVGDRLINRPTATTRTEDAVSFSAKEMDFLRELLDTYLPAKEDHDSPWYGSFDGASTQEQLEFWKKLQKVDHTTPNLISLETPIASTGKEAISFSAHEALMIRAALAMPVLSPGNKPTWADMLSMREWEAFIQKIEHIK